MSKPHISYKDFSINELKELGNKRFVFNTEYQRGPVWKTRQRQRLIDSLIQEYTIGALVPRNIGGTRIAKYEVLDGQQRLASIFAYLKGDFKTSRSSETPDLSFKDLKSKSTMYARFIAAPVFAVILQGGEEQDIAEIFTRLQEGTPLNTAEKLNAYTVRGKMRGSVIEWSNHNFFKNIAINANRFNHREICARFALVELGTDFENRRFPNLRFSDLSKMYEEHNEALPPKLDRRVRDILNFLHKSLGKDAELFIMNKTDLLQIYLLCSYLLRGNYSVKNDKFRSDFQDFTRKFISDVGDVSKRGVHEKYRDLRGRGQTPENIEKRFKIMWDLLSKSVKLKKTDENRLFTPVQKQKIYTLADGVCERCEKKVVPSQANYHHKVQYKNLGITGVENGALMHKKCHTEHHKQYGF